MKRKRTVILRVRLTHEDLDRLDHLACEFASELGRGVGRAALLRAMTRVGMDDRAQRPTIATHLGADTVRRGRSKAGSPVVGV
jgi:hypothetical protein